MIDNIFNFTFKQKQKSYKNSGKTVSPNLNLDVNEVKKKPKKMVNENVRDHNRMCIVCVNRKKTNVLNRTFSFNLIG